uniref:Putative LRR receptor-like serine/threonine-protein kinase At3g47570 n=1 Tax=Rhizophora mucronata TaxID=61149 RepID=A0A2P2KUQ9_RHIMU
MSLRLRSKCVTLPTSSQVIPGHLQWLLVSLTLTELLLISRDCSIQMLHHPLSSKACASCLSHDDSNAVADKIGTHGLGLIITQVQMKVIQAKISTEVVIENAMMRSPVASLLSG